MAPATPAAVQQLSLTYLGRPADPNSLTAWGVAGFSPEQIVLELVKTSEYQDAVAPFFTTTAVDFAGLISFYYNRLFGRNPVLSEINGWTDAVVSGAVNFDYLGITIANAALNLPDGTDIKVTLQAKLASADVFSAELAADPAANAAYNGPEAAAIGESFLNTVTSPPPATPADAAPFIAQLTTESLTLTTGLELQAAGTLPAVYTIDPGSTAQGGTLSVDQAATNLSQVLDLIEGAQNSSALNIGNYIFTVRDTLINVQSPEGQAVVAEAVSYSLINTIAVVNGSVAGVEAELARLQAIVNGATNGAGLELNATYGLVDSFDVIGNPANLAFVEGAASYTLTNPAGSLGQVTQDQAQVIEGATNADEYTFSTTFVLTASADTVSGGAGNTTFEAPAEATPFLPIQTLNNGDQLNGGGGRNTLNAQLVDVFTTPTSLANIQEVNLSGAGGLVPLLIPATLNVINANAIDTIGFRSPTNLLGGLQVTDLTTALTTVNIADDFLGTDFGIQFVGAALDGGDDSLDVNLTNAQGSILDLDTTAGFYETVNVNSGGFNPNTFTLETNEGPVSIFVTGNTDLDIDGLGDALDFDRLRLFDAQALNANLDADFTGGDAGGAMVEFFGAQGNTSFLIRAGFADADLMITTFGGDDDLDVNRFSGNITANLGGGTNTVTVDNVTAGSLAGDVDITTEDGDDTFAFEDVDGNVTVVAGNGTNTSTFRRIGGNVTASGGDVLDTFTFFSNAPNGAVAFTAGDSVDGGEGDLDRLRIETGGNTDRDLLLAGVGPNITGVEIIEHFGVFTGTNDLLVDMGRSGSAFILELSGTYSDDVRVTGLDFESGDVVRLFSDIVDDLELVNAPLSVGGFRLEMNGVTIGDDLVVGTGTADVVRILSTGLQSNIIDEANEIDARIEVTGDANINIGSAFGDEYNLDGGLIDARGLNAGLRTFLGDGEQTVNDSLGADQIWSISDGFGDNDIINLSDGGDVVGFDGTNSSTLIANQDLITGFVIDEDLVGLKVGGAGPDINLERTDNTAVSNGEAVNIRDVVSGDVANLAGSSFNFLKFTTAVDGAASVDDLFDAAIGGGLLTVGFGADVLGAAYDSTNGLAVLFRIDNGGLGITAADTAQGIAAIEMSNADFLAFDDIAFVDSYLSTI